MTWRKVRTESSAYTEPEPWSARTRPRYHAAAHIFSLVKITLRGTSVVLPQFDTLSKRLTPLDPVLTRRDLERLFDEVEVLCQSSALSDREYSIVAAIFAARLAPRDGARQSDLWPAAMDADTKGSQVEITVELGAVDGRDLKRQPYGSPRAIRFATRRLKSVFGRGAVIVAAVLDGLDLLTGGEGALHELQRREMDAAEAAELGVVPTELKKVRCSTSGARSQRALAIDQGGSGRLTKQCRRAILHT